MKSRKVLEPIFQKRWHHWHVSVQKTIGLKDQAQYHCEQKFILCLLHRFLDKFTAVHKASDVRTKRDWGKGSISH